MEQGSLGLSSEYSFSYSRLTLTVVPSLPCSASSGGVSDNIGPPSGTYQALYHTPPHSALGTYTPTSSLPLQGFARLQGFGDQVWARLVGSNIPQLAGILTCLSNHSSCKAA